MIMKTKHVKNTGTNGQEGEKLENYQGGKMGGLPGGKNGAKNCTGWGGHCLFCPIAIVRPWLWEYTNYDAEDLSVLIEYIIKCYT